LLIFALLAQADPRTMQALERIATAQTVIAAVVLLVGVIILATAVIALLQLRAARRQLVAAVNDMKPKLAPLIDRAKEATGDVAGMADSVRRKVDDVLHTVEELQRSVQRGSAATEERLRRFTAVLDVVQEEAEELLLDAAATAHGVHETARVLRESGSRQVREGPGRRQDDEEDKHE
jgi:methyl-accepting chemotaxis protein